MALSQPLGNRQAQPGATAVKLITGLRAGFINPVEALEQVG
jgi:hypothetical protein